MKARAPVSSEARNAPPLSLTSDIEMFQGNPLDYADDVVGVFQRSGRSHTREWLDWYFGSQGVQPVLSWMLRSRQQRRVVGLISVVPRVFRRGASLLRGGVVGNLFVDKDARGTLGAVQLLRAAESLVAKGRLDLLLAITGPDTQPLLSRMGFYTIGRWQVNAFVLSSGPLLRAALGAPGAVLAPLVDLGAGLLRTFHRVNTPPRAYETLHLTSADISRLRTEDWASPSGQFEALAEPDFLERHYLRDACKSYSIWGILDGSTVCGYLVVNSTRGGFHICDCRTNADKLSQADAILALCASKPFADNTVAVTTLPSTPTSSSLLRTGAVRVPVNFGNVACSLLGYWQPDQPLASDLSDASRWDIYIGVNDV